MNNIKILNKNGNSDYWMSFGAVIIYLYLIFFLLIKTGLVVVVVVMGLLPLIGFLYYQYLKDISTLLLILTLIPFIYLNSGIHYSLKYKILLDGFLFVFFILASFSKVLNIKNFRLKISYLMIPIYAISIYSIFSAIIGIGKGRGIYIVADELYNQLYYFMAIPIFYMIRKFKYYKIIIFIIIATSIVVSLEYIYLNVNSFSRITSFQGSIFPLIFGISLSYFIFNSKSIIKKSSMAIVGILILLGAYFIQTRTIWVSLLLTFLFIVSYYYVVFKMGNKIHKQWLYLGILFVILISGYGIVKSSSSQAKGEKVGNTTNTERLESISDPTKDSSFLMRIEVGYYIVKKFIKNPIFGDGFGGTVKYKIFGNSIVHYPDNSWLFFLWKEGIIGTSLFILLFWRLFKQSVYIFKNTNNTYTKIFILGIMGGFVGMLFASLLSANLIKYGKINFIYAIIFAYVEFERVELKNAKT